MVDRLIAPEKKILRHPEVLAMLRAGEAVYPINVEMDLSDACNLKCQWCAFAHLRRPVLMPYELADGILAQLVMAGVLAVTFSGGGEPTVNPEFGRIAQRAHDLGLKLGLYTNGVNTERVLPVAPLFAWVYVSLDAANAADYRRAKGADRFMAVLNSARLLAGRAKALGLGFLLTGDTWTGCKEMVTLRYATGASYVQFRPAVGLKDYRWVPACLGVLAELEGDGIYYSKERFLDLYRKHRQEYTACRGSELAPCIGADGMLWVCPNTRGLRPLGDLKTASFEAIWARRQAQRVGDDCRAACRNHFLNKTLDYVCSDGPHDDFV